MATYDLTQTTPAKLQTGDIINVPYSGTYKTITLPKGIYKLEVWGAQGGSFNTTYVGGKGGYSYGTLTLTDKETILYCYAGGKGTDGTTSGTFAGGWNGGGQAYTSSATYDMSAGGGGSDIRIGSTSLYARVIVAGGGGGAGSYSGSYRYSGGAGGGESGVAGSQYSASYKAGLAGSQTGAGTSYYGTTANSTSYGTVASFGTGASGSSGQIAGGGGGWYGGGYARRASGGGGSGYVYTSSTASNYPSGCLLTSAYYLTDAATVSGNTSFVDYSGSTVTGHSGNGYVRITVVEIKNSLKVKTSDGWKDGKSYYTKIESFYTPIPYIESTGTQYIDTGWYPTASELSSLKFVLDATYGTANSNGWAVSGCGSGGYYIHAGLNSSRQIVYGSGTADTKTSVTYTEKRAVFEVDYKNKKMKVTEVDSGTVLVNQSITVNTPTASSGKFYLFAYANTSDTTGVPYTGIIYSFKAYKNDVLIHDLIPVKDSNGVICMFDKVTQQFRYNIGTGQFYCTEPVVLPEGYEQLSYIDLTGTQYIKTGFNIDSAKIRTYKVVADMAVTGTSGWRVSGSGGSVPCWHVGIGNNNTYAYGNGSTDVQSSVTADNNRHIWTLDSKNGTFSVDDKINSTGITFNTGTATRYFSIGGYATSNTVTTCHAERIHEYKFYENDVLVGHYVPCKNSSGTIGMYDIVGNVFYSNAGTGSFNYGEVVEYSIVEKYEAWKPAQSVYIKTTENLTVLDYIESTGTQYIDTGFKPNQDARVVMDAQMTSSTKGQFYFATRTASTTVNFNLLFDGSTVLRSDYGESKVSATISAYNIRVLIDKNKNICTINNTVISNTASTFACQNNLFLFASNDGGTAKYFGNLKLYSCQIYDNGDLIRDYIPVLDKDGIACLYDKVTNQLFYNQGTGTFTAGYKTEFEANTELSFLESDGACYIDTGFMPNQNTRVIMECKALTLYSGGTFPFGTRTTYSSNAYAVALTPTQVFYNFGANYQFVDFSNIYEKISIDANVNSAIFKTDNEVVTITLENASFTTVDNLVLFSCCNSSSIYSGNSAWGGMIYCCKIYDNGTLIRDYIPKADTTGTPALFDKVSGTYYYNQGTGTFKAGTLLKRSYWKQIV